MLRNASKCLHCQVVCGNVPVCSPHIRHLSVWCNPALNRSAMAQSSPARMDFRRGAYGCGFPFLVVFSRCLSKTVLSFPRQRRKWLWWRVILWAFFGFSSDSGNGGIGALVSERVRFVSISQWSRNAGLDRPMTQKSAVALILRIVVLRWLIGVCMMSVVAWWLDCSIQSVPMEQHLCLHC